MADNDRRERGITLVRDMMGETISEKLRIAASADKFGSDITRMAVDHAFGDVWARKGWERKYRSLVTLGILIAQRQTGELKEHVKVGIANGLTVADLEEVLIQALPYVGFPCATLARSSIVEALRELDFDPHARVREERPPR